MSAYSQPALIDSTVFSNFAAAGSLALLHGRWIKLYMAQAVYEELQTGLAEGYTFLAELTRLITPPSTGGWLQVIGVQGAEELALYRQMPSRLHEGEAESLAIANQRNWTFLTDDKLARRVARQLNVEIIGTLGILIELVREGVLPLEEANELLTQMRARARYHSPVTDLAPYIKEAREE